MTETDGLRIAKSVQQAVDVMLDDDEQERKQELNEQAESQNGDLPSFVRANLSIVPVDILRRHLMDREREESDGTVEIISAVGPMP
jgi:hypothetical protein